jgi:molybdopterin/thiamine biosynthesis adenylyltransferase
MITDFSKQMELIKAHEFKHRINIIGAGALGSWLAFFLLKMGFSDIHVYDFDTIEEHNLPNQLYKETQIGQLKVDALYHIYKKFFNDEDDEPRIIIHNERLTAESFPLSGVVFCCVDTMSARKELYENLFKYNAQTPIWIEGRLSIWGAYIYSIESAHFEQYEQYEKTLYADTEAEVSACGVSQTALPSAVNCATMMIMQMIQWHKDGNLDLNSIEYSIPWLTSFTKKWTV